MKCSYACGTAEHVISRRSFLGGVAAAGVGAAVGLGRFTTPAVAAELERRERQVLVFWMAGGLSQLESWDPKPGTDTGGPFRAIPTSVPGTYISELLPRTARHMHRISLIRGLNTNENDHGKGAYMMHTGRPELPGQDYPYLGAVAARYLGSDGNPLPGYIRIHPGGGGTNTSEAAFLGPKYGPLYLGNGKPPANTEGPAELDAATAAARQALRAHANDRFARRRRTAETEAYTTSYEQALQLMERREVFDISREPEAVQHRYGSDEFGRHCLLARRLLEAGATYVQVTHSNYDTHNENFDFHLEQVGEFDHGFATIMDDLAASGRLQHTLVIVMSEFGRTPNINYLYGRDHWGSAWSIALAGAGINAGMLVGKTNDRGTEVVDREVGAGHLFHTYLRAVGLDPWEGFTANGRDIQIADPAATAIEELLA